MRRLDISSITNSSQMPLKKGTLQFIQDSYFETVRAVLTALIGATYDPTVVYVLYGVVNSSAAPGYNIAAGAVFFDGEVLLVDAASFTATGTNVGVFNIVQTQYLTDADPVTFTDGAVRNIHNIRKMQVIQAASNSGISDYSRAKYLNFTIPAQIQLALATGGPYANNVLQILGAYPDILLYVPAPPASNNPILRAGVFNIGDPDAGAGTDYTVTFPTVGTSEYYIMGTVISTGASAATDTAYVWTARGRTPTQFALHFREFAAGTAALSFEYILFAK